jgi:hypothetical protein
MAATVAATFFLCSGIVIQGWYKYRIAAQHPTLSYPPRILADVRPAVLYDAPRRVYPFSIIRGGAYSKEELIHALDSDPLAESHYQAFQKAQLRTVRSTFAKPVYVSYRKDDRIFWTNHPIRLHEGETVLTDGNLYARARCGNRISLVRQAPVAQFEPSPTVLDTAEPVEAIPELLRAAVEFQTTLRPAIDAGGADSPVNNAVAFDAPHSQILDETFRELSPAMMSGSITFSPPTGGAPTQFPIPYPIRAGLVQPPHFTFEQPSDSQQPVPEPSEFVLIAAGAAAFVLLRRRHARNGG